ncbi:Predicted acyltransferases [Butyrivibrio fibrisolvens 16/4]|nr:Predicted acyltransferases [Butyrivibrio fibrisolvens 16/4]
MTETRLKRADQIQFFRFICFAMIFLWHGKTWRIKYLPGDIGAQTGVYFFFLLTGVMASYSLALKEISPTKENIKDYLKRKLVRLYPLYFVTNLLTFLYNEGQGFVVSHSIKPILVLVGDFVLSSLMLQTWLLRPFAGNSVGWYLATMMWLSIVNIPFSAWAKSKRNTNKPIIRMVCIIVLALLYIAVISTLAGLIGLGDFGFMQTPLFCLGFHLIGLALGEIIIILKQSHPEWENQVKKYTIIEIVALLVWLVIVFIPGEMAFGPLMLGFFASIFLILVFMLGYGNISVGLRAKPLVFLGDISFECYLFHQIIITIYAHINGWDSLGTLGNAYALTVCMAVTVCLSWLVSNVKLPFGREKM